MYFEPLLRSQINHTCDTGKVFEDTYKEYKINTCVATSGGPFWEFDTTNNLPDCVRK